MLREIRALGFDHAELSHGTRISLLPGILDAVAAGEMKISSVHNFCPLPVGVDQAAPNLYEFSDKRLRDRELAERYTRKTIEFAARVKAPVIVLHLGSLDVKDYTHKLEDMLERGEEGKPGYARLCEEVRQKREAKKRPYLLRVFESLRKLLPEAEARGIKFGIENREALEELPLEGDFQSLFREFASPAIGYWHDTGHAQIKENLGFVDHAAHVESLRDRLLGFHIHDVQFPARDHCAPGSGVIDWAALRPMAKPEHIKVFEFSPALTAEEVKSGVAHVKAIWGNE
jgi:sugar phosphate isomerase/epimerase